MRGITEKAFFMASRSVAHQGTLLGSGVRNAHRTSKVQWLQSPIVRGRRPQSYVPALECNIGSCKWYMYRDPQMPCRLREFPPSAIGSQDARSSATLKIFDVPIAVGKTFYGRGRG